MATRLELQGFVYDKLGLPTDDGLITAAQVQSALNAALQEYATEADWPWLQTEVTITTVSGTATYALPTRYVRTLYVLDDVAEQELEYRPPRQLAIYGTETGYPRFYTGLVGTIKLVPKPSSVVALRHGYVLSEAPLTADGSTPLLPDPYVDFLVTIAARKLAVRLADPGMKRALDDEHDQWLARLRDEMRRTKFLGGVKAVWRGV